MIAQGPEVIATDRRSNDLLACLSEPDFALLAPHLQSCHSTSNEVLYEAGDSVGSIYFPCGACLVSHVLDIKDGRKVEPVLVGREGAVGLIPGPHKSPAYSGILAKVGGPFFKLSAIEFEKAKNKSQSLRDDFDRYMEYLLAQLMQIAACNAVHTIEQRMAKWIIAIIEHTHTNEVPFTQDQFAALLGVGRSYTARVIQTFKMEGILGARRGAILVLDRQALQATSCRCDEQLKALHHKMLGDVDPKPHRRRTRDQRDHES